MSKKKSARQIEEEKRKKENKSFLIALICTVLIIAGVIAILVLAPGMEKGQNTDADEETKNSSFEYVPYGEGEIPEVFSDILNNAKTDSENACKKYGVGMTVGNTNYSVPEMVMVYRDCYTEVKAEADSKKTQYGYNVMNFPYNVNPASKEHPDGGTWEDYFFDATKAQIRSDAYYSDLALRNGYRMSDREIKSVNKSFEDLETYAEYYEGSMDQVAEESYTEGTTYNMFRARQILHALAVSYRKKLIEEKKEDLSQSEIKSEYKDRELEFKRFFGRIYPIVHGTDFSSCKTEEEFLKLAAKDSQIDSFDPEEVTSAFYVSYRDIELVYNSKVADYAFSDERKAGEISTVNNGHYDFAVYIEEPARPETTVSATVFFSVFDSTTDDTAEKDENQFTALYDEWIESGGTKDALLSLCDTYDEYFVDAPYGEINVNCGDLPREVESWLKDSSRKKGDHEKFIVSGIGYMVYFEKVNKNDYEWYTVISEELAAKDIDAVYAEESASGYKMTVNVKNAASVPEIAYNASAAVISN